MFETTIKGAILLFQILMTDSDSWEETKDLVSVFKVNLDELPAHKIGPTISLKVSLDQTLDFIKALLLPIPLELAAYHGKLFGLDNGSIRIRIL